MKTARRHELKENDLAHYLETVVEWSSDNAKLIVLAIVGVAAVIAALIFFQQRSKQNAAAAWDQEYQAETTNDTQKLEQFVNAHKSMAAGQLANLFLADMAFEEGVSQMSVDRKSAEDRLNDAKNRYYDVQQIADDPRIEQRAVLGLARYFETIGDLDKAKEHYTQLAKIENGLYRKEAERKLADLARSTTKEFAKWYSALRPKPQAPTSPLIQSKLDETPAFPGSEAAVTAPGTASATPTATGAPAATTGKGTAPSASGTAPSASGTTTSSTAPAGSASGTAAVRAAATGTATAPATGTATSGTAPSASPTTTGTAK